MDESAQTGWTTLVQAEALAGALGRADLVIVDCRESLADRGAGERAWREAHIPGAVHADLARDLSDMRREGEGRHPWPLAADFTRRLGQWGITREHQVVAYDDGDGAFAARLWFLLRTLGHARVAVLDGGLARWTALGLPLDSGIPQPAATTYEGTFDASRLLDATQVQARLDAGDVLLDVRAAPRFRGEIEPLDRVAGHVPGARNAPYAENLADGRFRSPAELARMFRAAMDGREPERTIAMCGSGVTACHLLLAMEHAGLPGAKLFTGSWSGWIADPSRPVATGN
jgi:thiosulfate/3-mercaptopyruvate sulfurtransferase